MSLFKFCIDDKYLFYFLQMDAGMICERAFNNHWNLQNSENTDFMHSAHPYQNTELPNLSVEDSSEEYRESEQ